MSEAARGELFAAAVYRLVHTLTPDDFTVDDREAAPLSPPSRRGKTVGETLMEYLARVRRKDVPKGGDGWRSTRQIATYFGWSLPTARRALNALYDREQIEVAVNGSGLEWRSPEQPHDR